jgi:hypothetical protein
MVDHFFRGMEYRDERTPKKVIARTAAIYFRPGTDRTLL